MASCGEAVSKVESTDEKDGTFSEYVVVQVATSERTADRRMSRIGILYPGELGAALGRAVVERGGTATTCLLGRSPATCGRAAVAGFLTLQSLDEVIRGSELIVSVVPPACAMETAYSIAAAADRTKIRTSRDTPMVVVDGNSISPQRKRKIAEILECAGIACVDGSVFGPAGRLRSDALFALSGPDAERVASLLDGAVQTEVLGCVIGQAASAKMAIAFVTKALIALFLEMICASAASGDLVTTLDVTRRFYPGIIRFVERNLPTYPARVDRRIGELEEVEAWQDELGQPGAMIRAARITLEGFRRAGFEPRTDWSFDELVHRIGNSACLD